MPPYEVQPGCGGNPKPARAADSRPYDMPSTWSVGRGAHTLPLQAAATTGLAVIATLPRRHVGMPPYEVQPGCGGNPKPVRAADSRPSVSKKSFRHAGRIFKLSKKFKNTCRLNAKGAFCPLHTSPAALSQTSSARFFDSLRAADSRPYGRFCFRVPKICAHAPRLRRFF